MTSMRNRGRKAWMAKVTVDASVSYMFSMVCRSFSFCGRALRQNVLCKFAVGFAGQRGLLPGGRAAEPSAKATVDAQAEKSAA